MRNYLSFAILLIRISKLLRLYLIKGFENRYTRYYNYGRENSQNIGFITVKQYLFSYFLIPSLILLMETVYVSQYSIDLCRKHESITKRKL